MPDKAHRPYLFIELDNLRKKPTPVKPLEDHFTRYAPRYLSQSNIPESEFEKPQDEMTPRKLHFDAPTPDWPGPWNPPYGSPTKPKGSPAGPGCPHCALAFDSIQDCSEDWGEAHAMIYCSHQPGADCPDCQMSVKAILGSIIDIQPGTWSRMSDITPTGGWQYQITDPVTGQLKWVDASKYDPQGLSFNTTWRQKIAPISGTMSLKVRVDASIANHVLHAEMIDGGGNYCEAYLEVTCGCECPPKVAFTVDAANTDLITAGKTANVAVLGGCSQYNWQISGTGWSIAPNGYSDLMSATVTVNTSVCNAVTSVPIATVTITDKCGTVLTQNIRHEGGSWGSKCSWDSGVPCGWAGCAAAGCIVGDVNYSYETNSLRWKYQTYDCRLDSNSCSWNGTGPAGCVTLGFGTKLPSLCTSSAHDCDNGKGCSAGCSCIPTNVDYQEWGC